MIERGAHHGAQVGLFVCGGRTADQAAAVPLAVLRSHSGRGESTLLVRPARVSCSAAGEGARAVTRCVLHEDKRAADAGEVLVLVYLDSGGKLRGRVEVSAARARDRQGLREQKHSIIMFEDFVDQESCALRRDALVRDVVKFI